MRVQGNVEVEFASDAPWMTVTPGDTRALVEWHEFTVAYEENTAEQTPRTGTIRFFNTEKKLESVLTVTQAGAPASGVYFQDDFEWLEPWAAYTIDDVANNSVGTSPNAFTKAEVAGALTELQNRGYGYVWGWKGQDWSDGLPDNGSKQTLYFMHNYLKFGKTSYNSGIILPALGKMTGTENVDLTFDWCWCMTGASKPDIMTLTVTVTGGGYLADTGTEVSGNIESGQPTEGDLTVLAWQHAKVTILGATPSTRITIRPTNADPSVTSTRKQNRWYLDNIKVEKSDYVPPVKEYYADDFEWLQKYIDGWVVANPGDADQLDPVGSQLSSHAQPNIWNLEALSTTLGAELESKGYEDLNKSAKTLYLQKNYFKMGANKKQTGLKLPAIAFEGDTPVDVVLTFDWCAHMGGSGSVDDVTITVELEGAGTCEDSGAALSNPIATTQETGQMVWQHASVTLKGVTSATRIKIRPTNMGSTPNYQRWHLDNIRITGK